MVFCLRTELICVRQTNDRLVNLFTFIKAKGDLNSFHSPEFQSEQPAVLLDTLPSCLA